MNNIIKRIWNQGSMTPIEDLQGSAFTNENGGHTFQISGVDSNGEALALSGTVAASFLRPDQTTVGISGSVSGGVASVTLSEECYGIPGRFGLVVFLTSDGKKTAIYSCVGNVARSSTDAVAPGVTADVVDLINEIETAVGTIPASYSALMADIAPTYSSSALYAVGDYAWYEGDLKRCIVPITVGETYTPAHWTSAVVGDDVCALKSAINTYQKVVIGEENYISGITWVNQYYINQNGEEVFDPSDNFHHTDEISTGDSESVILSLKASATGSTVRVHGYDENGDWVRQIVSYSVIDTILHNYTIAISSDIKDIKISCAKAVDIIMLVDSNTIPARFAEVIDLIENADGKISEINGKIIIKDDLTNLIMSGLAVNNSASVGSTLDIVFSYNGGWGTAIFPCKKGDKLTISGRSGVNYRAWCIVDSENKIVSQAAASTNYTNHDVPCTVDGTVVCCMDVSYTMKIEKTTPFEYADISDLNNDDGIITGTVTEFGYGWIQAGTQKAQEASFQPDKINGSGWVHYITPCKADDTFVLTGRSGQNTRAYYFTDKNGIIVDLCPASQNISNLEVSAKIDGFFIFNSPASVTHSVNYRLQKKTKDNWVAIETIRKQLSEKENALPFMLEPVPQGRHTVSSVPYNGPYTLTINEIYAGYDELVENYPNYITKTDLGLDQSEEYHIYKYVFTPELPPTSGTPLEQDGVKYTQSSYKTIILDACLHGNERPCARAMLNLMTLICEARASDNALGWLRNNVRFIVVPLSNPWGYVNGHRYNSRHVDLNRNFPIFWANGGSTDPTSNTYKGEYAGSEAETQIMMELLEDNTDALFYYNWHTFGVFTSYAEMTDFEISFCKMNNFEQAGFQTIKDITYSGWANHQLPENSGYIGQVHFYSAEACGMAANYGAYLGIPSAIPECMYRYYDGGTDPDYSTKINCMNVEYQLFSIINALRQLY